MWSSHRVSRVLSGAEEIYKKVSTSSFTMNPTNYRQSLQPEYTIAFSANNFISAVLKPFIVTYAAHVLIQGYALHGAIQDLLDCSPEMRVHTDLLLFHVQGSLLTNMPSHTSSLALKTPQAGIPSIICYRYSWYHSHRRPWGIALPMGCPDCGCIRSWLPSKAHPQGAHPKARITSCKSDKCTFKICTQPLPYKYDLLQSDKVSGWLKYTICNEIL